MIRNSKHTLKFTNKNKLIRLNEFLIEYNLVADQLLDYIWNNKIKHKYGELDIKNNIYDIPKYLDYKELIQLSDIKTELSARSLSSLVTQLVGVIKSQLKNKKKRKFKPSLNNFHPELSSKCIDYQLVNKEFNGFIRIKSIGKKYGHIKIPIKYHKHSNSLYGKLMASFLITNKNVEFRWHADKNKKKTNNIIGSDQGINTLLTLSDGQTTPMVDKQGIHYHDIITKIKRKKQGSENYNKSLIQRNNFIRWSLNQLNFDDIDQINYEDIKGIKFKKKLKYKKHLLFWNQALILTKIDRLCDENEVHLNHIKPYFRSQRCFNCGLVLKSNRNNKNYKCKCGYENDADMNAALNNTLKLKFLNFKTIDSNKGFYWMIEGSIESPLHENDKVMTYLS